MQDGTLRGDELWWVEAAGRRYGPFPATRMIDFVTEGRIVADTRVCRAGEDWRKAEHVPFLARVLADVLPTLTMRMDSPAPPGTAFVVWAKLSGFVDLDFLAALTALGPVVEIEPGMWIVRTAKPAAEARKRLSASLSMVDKFFIAPVSNRLVGWRNLGPTTEARLRDLFRAVAALSPAND